MLRGGRRRARFVAAFVLVSTASLVPLPSPAEEPVPASPVEPSAQAATGRDARADLNGDGEADLVVAGDEYRPRFNTPTWTLTVIYGSSNGLSRRANQVWRETDFGPTKPARGEITGLVTGDFDGDGFHDVAVGTDNLDESEEQSQERVGEVRILFGSRTGVVRSRSQVLTPRSDDRLPVVDDDPSFGWVLAVADLGRGAQDDLAIGSPLGASESGQVTVVYGSRTGLVWAGRQVWTQDVAGVPGSSADRDAFGSALVAADFGRGSHADLAIGVPGEGATTRRPPTGAVVVLYGSSTGVTAVGAQQWSQASPGVKGKATDDERFGTSLAAGHFAGRKTADLAVGVPYGEDAGKYAGEVNILYGSKNGITARGDQLWTRRSRGIAGRKYLDASFGGVVVAGNFGKDRGKHPYDDLAISAWYEKDLKGSSWSSGAIEVLYGTSRGLASRGSQVWRLSSPGIKGTTDRLNGDGFGGDLAAGDFGKSRYADLAVADDLMEVDSQHYGATSVIYGSATGLTARGDQLWSVQRLGRPETDFWASALG